MPTMQDQESRDNAFVEKLQSLEEESVSIRMFTTDSDERPNDPRTSTPAAYNTAKYAGPPERCQLHERMLHLRSKHLSGKP